MSKLISIIIPVYNVEKYLEKCIQSIINQTYSEIEIICINDGSTDRSLEILQGYAKNDKRIKLINRENKGRQYTRKEGLEIARGKYVMFVDSDDWIDKEMVEKMVEIAIQYKADVIKTSFIMEDMNNGKQKKNDLIYSKIKEIKKKDFVNEIYPKMIKTYQYNQMWGQLINKNKINMENMENGIDLGEDLIFNLELYNRISSVVYIPKFYYHYRINIEKNKSNVKKVKKAINDIYNYHMELLKYIKIWKINTEENIEIIKNEMIKRVIELTSSTIKYNIKTKEMLEILEYSREKLIELYPKKNKQSFIIKLYLERKYTLLIEILRLKLYCKKIKKVMK